MKKITLQIFGFLFLFSTLTFGQTYTSGLFNIVNLSGTTDDFNAQIDINITTDIVTLTLIGPDSGWLAMGFDSFGHDNADVIMFDNTINVDRQFTGGRAEPILDGTQDWTVNSTTAGGLRTVVATRARDTGDANDYVFSAAPAMTTLDIVASYSSNFDTGNRHDERDFVEVTFSEALGIDEVNQINFSMSPNPATSNLKIVLPSNLTNSSIEIFDMLSRKIYNGNMINTHFSLIDVSTWGSGVYLVRISNGTSSQTKRFVKQ